ncbi:MAG: hypothetical protein IKF71_03875 [Bacilli bacterium]|nr:hypothetical protein [Bacilli bacterium]
MRIGVDMDDTICRTTEMVHERLEKYAETIHLNPLDIMNDEDLREKFFSVCAEDIYKNAEIKRSVKDVLKRLKSKGNEIYIITAREDNIFSSHLSAYDVTKTWLDEHEIPYDKIITSAYGIHRAEVCKEEKIDLMIDDNPYNFKELQSMGVSCLLFDDREKYVLKEDYVTNWLDIEKYIERNH